MIAYIKGNVIARDETKIIVQAKDQSLGYGLHVCTTTLAKINHSPTNTFQFWVHTVYSQDAVRLYGFLTEKELVTFCLLVSIPGVGAKVSLAILATISPDQLYKCIQSKDSDLLCSVPGIGKKMAQKILLELGSKLDKWPKFYRYKQIQSVDDTSNTQKTTNSFSNSNSPSSSKVIEEFDLSTNIDNNQKSWEHSLLLDLRSALTNLNFSYQEISFAINQISHNIHSYQLKHSDQAKPSEDQYTQLFSENFKKCCNIIKAM